MNTPSMLLLAAIFLVPLGILVWLYQKEPAWALIAVIVIGAIIGMLGGGGSVNLTAY